MTHNPGRHNTRLSILFVAAILIPGSFLAYFSIQNIGSQKELAEKKLLEEEETLVEELGKLLKNELLRSATEFFPAAKESHPNLQDVAHPAEANSYVTQIFALDNVGRMLWPEYIESGSAGALVSVPPRFFSLLSNAQQNEFVRKDYGKAAQLYREAKEAAGDDAGCAAAINGLARVLAKNRQPEQSSMQYQILLERYGLLRDENGVCFARYALHQLNRIGSSDQAGIRRQISKLLFNFEKGEMPLSDQTDLLLREIEELLKQDPGAIHENDPIPAQISRLRRRLEFVNQDTKHIDFFQSEHPASYPLSNLGSFGVLATQVLGNPRLFVIQQNAEPPHIMGFRVNLEYLQSILLEQASRIHTSFPLKVDILSGADEHPAEDSMNAVRDLSPLTPWWRVSVRPEDPAIILQYTSRRHWIYGTTLILLLAGMVLGVVLVLRDMSRERRLSELRTEFVANVTHELKTPLTSIRMFAETLRMKRARSETEQRECLNVIVGETQRLSRLINTVLDFSKIERGQKQYQMTEINVSEVAKSTLNTLKYSLEEQGFELAAEIESGVHAMGDADALEQAMLNLIDNAVKYSRRTKSVRIGLWAEDNHVCFRVTDKGIGIAENEKNRIFEKFFRARTGNERDTGGAGLGLTVVKHIVEAHGGTIEVESKMGEGSSFTIKLPRFQEVTQE